MNGNFTRTVLEPVKHFVRVLMQQGRVTLDGDWADPPAGKAGPRQSAPAEIETGGGNAEARKPD